MFVKGGCIVKQLPKSCGAFMLTILLILILFTGCQPAAAPTPAANTTLYVLMYHHFVVPGEDCNDVTTTTDRFREDLKWLVDNGYTFVLPRDLASGAPLPEKAVMITVDDGYTSNYDLAFPILKEFNAKAVIALITHCMDYVDWAMTWDMCREMAQSGLVEFGSHTHNFHKYDETYGAYGIQRRPKESQAEYEARVFADLQTSIDLIEANVGQEVLYFAYPHGKTDRWSDQFLREHFKVTTTTQVAPADISKGLYQLARYNINAVNRPWQFLD